MALTAGTRLGHYEIIDQLGAGGMGEVYRGRDTRLGRTVAVKVLAEHLGEDAERRKRFEREAKAVSSLNHPHICTLHDIGEQDGVHYLVMEYVEGETLQKRVERGRLPFDQALEYAIQIADALDTAHRKGVVHRDLKPGNLMLAKSGVKLLDFGLAKLKGDTGQVYPLPQMSTAEASYPLTAEGTILGTLQYMAPEQLEGKDADARSDIFAFGAIVYEMVTGKKAFEAKSQASLIHAIMGVDPQPMAEFQTMIPPALERLVRVCLTKAPEDRWQTVRDMFRELRWIEDEAGQADVMETGVVRASMHRLAWLLVAILAVAFVSAILYFTGNVPTAPEMRVEINMPSSTGALFGAFAISPDGRQLVFAASEDGEPRLWLRSLAAATAEPLPGTEGARLPFWSPDGRSVAFFTRGNLMRIDIGGGLPQKLAETGVAVGGTWSANGVILFAPSGGSPLFRAPASGDNAVALTTLDPPRQTSHLYPSFLPNGRQFVFYVTGTEAGIYLGSLDSRKTKRLTTADTTGAYLTPNWLLFVHQGSLVARRLDLSQAVLSGNPVTVAEGVTAFSVSTAGSVAYWGARTDRRQLTWFDRSGKILGTVGVPDENGLFDPELSPDGRQVAVHRTVQGNTDVWLLDETRRTRFTFDEGVDMVPLWSPDGSRIVFRTNRNGVFDLYEKPSSGNGEEKLLLESPENKLGEDWWSNFLVYYTVDSVTAADLWIHPLDGGDPFVFLETPAEENRAQFSPDGRWLAYQANESGQDQIFVRPFRGAGGQYQVSTSGGVSPRWRPDGKELYYISLDGTLMAVPTLVSGAVLVPGSPVGLFKPPIVRINTRQQYDVAPDGRFLINVYTEDRTSYPITLLLNWKPKSDE